MTIDNRDETENDKEVAPISMYVVDFSKFSVVSISYCSGRIYINFWDKNNAGKDYMSSLSLKMYDISQYDDIVKQYEAFKKKNATNNPPAHP